MIINPRKAIEKGWVTSDEFPMESNQLQPNGIDLRIKSATKLPIHVPFLMLRSGTQKLNWYKPEEGYKGNDITTILFERLIPYLVDFHEYVSIPNGVSAEVIGRSTLNRNGVWCRSSLYDAGFNNVAGLTLYPFVPFEVEKGCRLAQIVFQTSERGSRYEGQYQGSTNFNMI